MKSLLQIITVLSLLFFSSSMTSKNISRPGSPAVIPLDSPQKDSIGPNSSELKKTIERIDKTIDNGKAVIKQISKNASIIKPHTPADTVVKVVPIVMVDCPDTIAYKPNLFQRIKNILKSKKRK